MAAEQKAAARPTRRRDSRRGWLLVIMAVFGVWAVIVGNFGISCGDDLPDVVPEPEPTGREGRGYLMLADSLSGLGGASSISFMYMTGQRWTAGDVVGPDRFNARVIIGKREESTEYELREVAGDRWWRERGGDGWRVGHLPEGIDMALEPFSLFDNSDALLEGVESVVFAGSQSIDNALDQRIDTHRLYGTMRVDAIRAMGLKTVNDPADDATVRFMVWVEQETGMPAQLTFLGVPPSGSPLGVLHIFDVNELAAGAIVEPSRSAFAEGPWVPPEKELGVTLEFPRAPLPARLLILTPTAIEGGSDSVDAPPAEQGADDQAGTVEAVQRQPADGTGPVPEIEPGSPLFMEVSDGGQAGWLRYTLPTEGYLVEVPTVWPAVGDLDPAGRGHLSGSTESGGVWVIWRRSAVGSLLGLGEARIQSLHDDGLAVEDAISMEFHKLPRGSALSISYTAAHDDDSPLSTMEYVIVRAQPGRNGLAYGILFQGAGLVDPDGGLEPRAAQIVRSFTLLGADETD